MTFRHIDDALHTHTRTPRGGWASKADERAGWAETCRHLGGQVVVLPQPRAAVQLVEGGRQAGEGQGRGWGCVGGGVRVLPGHGGPRRGGRGRRGGHAVGVVQGLRAGQTVTLHLHQVGHLHTHTDASRRKRRRQAGSGKEQGGGASTAAVKHGANGASTEV